MIPKYKVLTGQYLKSTALSGYVLLVLPMKQEKKYADVYVKQGWFDDLFVH